MSFMIGIPFWEFTSQGVCLDGKEDTSTRSQLDCQNKCEGTIGCVGISYYDDYSASNCIICNNDTLNQSSPYAFYKIPGNWWITWSK